MKKYFGSMLAVFGLGLTVAIGAAWAIDVTGVTCPVSGAPVKEDASVDYRGGKLYFCCNKCPVSYGKDKQKYATKANLQLVASGQAAQEKCPISKHDFDEDTTLDVGGVSVKFCCDKCVKAVTEVEGDDKLDLVFGDKVFDDAYKVTAE